jgi:hypothetical protein
MDPAMNKHVPITNSDDMETRLTTIVCSTRAFVDSNTLRMLVAAVIMQNKDAIAVPPTSLTHLITYLQTCSEKLNRLSRLFPALIQSGCALNALYAQQAHLLDNVSDPSEFNSVFTAAVKLSRDVHLSPVVSKILEDMWSKQRVNSLAASFDILANRCCVQDGIPRGVFVHFVREHTKARTPFAYDSMYIGNLFAYGRSSRVVRNLLEQTLIEHLTNIGHTHPPCDVILGQLMGVLGETIHSDDDDKTIHSDDDKTIHSDDDKTIHSDDENVCGGEEFGVRACVRDTIEVMKARLIYADTWPCVGARAEVPTDLVLVLIKKYIAEY